MACVWLKSRKQRVKINRQFSQQKCDESPSFPVAFSGGLGFFFCIFLFFPVFLDNFPALSVQFSCQNILYSRSLPLDNVAPLPV